MTNSEHVSTETLADYAEGLLRESEAASVGAHLEGCAECHAEELLLASLSEILAADDPGPMPAAYAARIDAALAEVALSHPVGSGSAGSAPGSGSFHPEGSQGAALDLTPAALAAASPNTGPSADVIDINARRKVVAQGLSRVTTVAASIVLLIGGTVLGLQALNNNGDSTVEPFDIAAPAQTPGAQSTIQPSPFRLIKNPAVEIDKKGKWNPDGSWTNRSGTVINKDGTAVLPLTGQVIKPSKSQAAAPIPDPAHIAGPLPAGQSRSSKNPDSGSVTAAKKPDPVAPAPVVSHDPAANDPANDPSTPEPETTPAAAGAPTPDSAAAEPAEARVAEAPRAPAAPEAATKQAPAVKQEAYVEDSRSAYTEENFAAKVLALVEKSQYRASSIGEPVVEPADEPAVSTTEEPATTDSSSASEVRFHEASIATAAPAAATAPEVTEAPAAESPAGDRIKARVERCARQLGGQAIAGDTGTWKGEPVTIVVMPDPDDSQQVIGRAISGPCNQERPAPANVQHLQYVYLRQ